MEPVTHNIDSHKNIAVISNPKLGFFQVHRGRRVRTYFREYCENTGIHGFKYLAEKRSWCERISWAILIITSISVCGFMISRIYRKFGSSPVIVTFATKESPIFTIPFPAVTVCPIVKTSKLKFRYASTYFKKLKNESLTSEQEKIAQYISLFCDIGADVFPQSDTFPDDFFDKIFQLKSPMLFRVPCIFMNKKMPCRSLFKPLITDEGLCYTFNMLNRKEIFRNITFQPRFQYLNNDPNDNVSEWNIDKGYFDNSSINSFPKRALLSGADNALEIILGQITYDTSYLCSKSVQGFNVMLHAPHSLPRPKELAFNVPLDTVATIVVQPKMITTSPGVKKYNPVNRECYFSFERPLKFFNVYSPDNCRLECQANHTLKKCDCVSFFMPRENGTLICGNGKLNCTRSVERQIMRGLLNKLMKMEDETSRESVIYCDCMPLCTQLSYDTEQTQGYWYWKEKSTVLSKKKFKANYNLSKISIYFKTDYFWTTERNELYGTYDFLANIGGLLGLFTGFSFLSLVEIIYFLSLRIWFNRRHRKVCDGVVKDY